MIIKYFTIGKKKIKTFQNAGIMTRGYAWVNSEFSQAEGIADFFSDIQTPGAFKSRIGDLNGSFSICKETIDYMFLASDRFGSYPLYYAVTGTDIFVSDSTEWIVKKTGYSEINQNAERDITYTGYSYHNETLVKGIYQVIASECVIIRKSDHNVDRKLHFIYEYDKDRIVDSDSLAGKFDTICKTLGTRLVQSLNGRNCIVFLSGGVDSRFCAYLLKIAGYSDKTTLLTYGSRLSPDYKAAVKAGRLLGMRHIFVPYKRSDWRKTFKDSESLEFIRYAQNLSISAHLREHFVVKDILQKGLINKDDIIIPGHLGTVTGREYTKEELKSIDTTHNRLIEQTVLFYNMKRFKDSYEYLLNRTRSLFPAESTQTDPLYYLSVYHNAAACTYSIKYLMNSLRAYDFYGMEWRLPLLDNELVDFFNLLPFESIVSKAFFKEYVSSKIDVPYSEFSKNFLRKVFRNILDARYACIDLKLIFKLKNKFNSELSVCVRAYRYLRNFSTFCSVYELEMMKTQIKNIYEGTLSNK